MARVDGRIRRHDNHDRAVRVIGDITTRVLRAFDLIAKIVASEFAPNRGAGDREHAPEVDWTSTPTV